MSGATAARFSTLARYRIRDAQRRLMREALLLPDAQALTANSNGLRPGARPGSVPAFVIHWRAPEWCVETVNALLTQDGVRIDVRVLDNSADDRDVSERLRRMLPPSVRVEPLPGNPGFAAAANRALDLWQTSFPERDVALVLCHDCILEPDAVAHLVDALSAHRDVGIVGPRMVGAGGAGGAEADDGLAGVRCAGSCRVDPSSSAAVPRAWVTGACMAIRRALLDTDVRFRLVLHSYMEDVAFCLDAGDAGWRTAEVPSARAVSHGSRVGDRRWRLIARNTVHLASLRRGVGGVVLAVSNYALVVVLHALAAIDPRRTPAARRSSGRRMRAIACGSASGIASATANAVRRRVDFPAHPRLRPWPERNLGALCGLTSGPWLVRAAPRPARGTRRSGGALRRGRRDRRWPRRPR